MDLVKLGFIPAGMEQTALESGVVEVLSEVYTEFAGGGGAAKIDVNAVITKLSGLADKYGNIFQVPPYFAYIAKAFGVLEGIGLGSNPNYAIVGKKLEIRFDRVIKSF
jgi:predicted unusual protein kinase regulating ubiquinone biosynthesis (AarF/ABC1/UbiB family)